MSFFLIYGSEDGTRIIQFENPEDLKQLMDDCGLKTFRSDLGNSDTNYWDENEALLIKGNVIKPKPKQVVQDWEL